VIIAKYGLGFVFSSWIIFFILLLISYFTKQPALIIMTVLIGIFSTFNVWFFRDPERLIPNDPNVILSPADGKVIQITEVDENVIFKAKVKRISIFLSVFDIHVNRVPVSGKVEYFNYHKGSFLPAFKDKASLDNEQTVIGIVTSEGEKILFTQIAGIIARRIVCDLREGHKVTAGERMGMIRYGSRVDIYVLEENVTIKVEENDKVKGGESIIGVFK
jgi:phosphatidylserine decarboxylase